MNIMKTKLIKQLLIVTIGVCALGGSVQLLQAQPKDRAYYQAKLAEMGDSEMRSPSYGWSRANGKVFKVWARPYGLTKYVITIGDDDKIVYKSNERVMARQVRGQMVKVVDPSDNNAYYVWVNAETVFDTSSSQGEDRLVILKVERVPAAVKNIDASPTHNSTLTPEMRRELEEFINSNN